MSTGEEETPDSLFPGFDEGTKQFLFNLNFRLNEISNFSGKFDIIFCYFSIFINFFHLIVLSRKSMRTSVINLILISISLTYIIYLFLLADLRLKQTEDVRPECDEPSSFFQLELQKIYYSLLVFSSHSSTWLGILMAFIRLLIIKFPFNYRIQKFGNLKIGLKLIFLTIILSFPISFLYYFRFEIVDYGSWSPDESCPGFASNYSTPAYFISQSDLFSNDEMIIYRFYLFAEGIFGKLLPAFIYPILTVFLISELKAGDENRKRLGGSSENSRNEKKTTKLVVSMTIFHLICDLPKGLLALAQSFLIIVPGYLTITSSILVLLTTLFIINTVIQCFICCAMSSNYRNTLVGFFGRIGVNPRRNEISISTLVV